MNLKRLSISCLFAIVAATTAVAQDAMETGKRLYEQAEGHKHSTIKYDVQAEFQRAVPYLKRATEEGFGEAAFLLGNVYFGGYAGREARREAAALYQKALDLGHHRGYVELGKCYLENKAGVQRDDKKAFELFAKGVDNNEPDARVYIALCWFYGLGVEKPDLNVAYMNCRNSVDRMVWSDDDNLRYMWGAFCYHPDFATKNAEGQMVKQDLETACEMLYNTNRWEHLEKASELMHERHLTSFFQRYYGNFRVSVYQVLTKTAKLAEDYDHVVAKVLYWYALEAEREGSSDGDTYIKQNWGYTRVEALTKAAQLGYADAQKLLGDWYEAGHNVSKNLLRAKEWHAKAEANNE